MRRLFGPTGLATALGLGLAAWIIWRLGVNEIVDTVAGVGIGGFLLFVLSYLLVLAMLGAAWAASTRDRSPLPLWRFAWARAVREAASDLLPFSQVGGLLLGLRVLVKAGLSPGRAGAGAIIDLTTEMASQLLLVLAGVLIAGLLLSDSAGVARLHGAASIGVAVLAALTLAFVLLQRPALRLAARLAARLLPAAGDVIEQVRIELGAFGGRPAALIPSFLCNAAAWLLAIVSAWLGLFLLGADVPFSHVLAIEALIFALRSCAFFLPGAIGVQEAGYALLGPLLGIDRDMALALSLLKRVRDVAIGVPTLLLYQAAGLRRGNANVA